jgi:iron complex transport system permease protein
MAVTRIYGVAVLVLLLCICVALLVGAVPIPLSDLISGWSDPHTRNQAEVIIETIRLPRVMLAALVGALLAASGAVMQGLFRNPLADPSLIGVTAGASAGGSVMIVLTASSASVFFSLWLISFGAFIGGIVSVYFVYRLATRAGATSVATMLLAGIAITALVSSLTGTLEFFANNDLLRRISLWKMGGLDGANYARVLVVAIIAIVFFLLIPRFAPALNALLLGESEARHLGFEIEKIKRILIILVAAVVGTSVAMAGTIAFVGLVVPHMVRLIIGPNHRTLLPLSAVSGAILMLVADTLARTVVSPAELPVGLVTAIIGAPFFISLLLQRFQYGFNAA